MWIMLLKIPINIWTKPNTTRDLGYLLQTSLEKYFYPSIITLGFSLPGFTIPYINQIKAVDPNPNPLEITPLTSPFLLGIYLIFII